MKYRVVKQSNRYDVIEVATGHLIRQFDRSYQAYQHVNHLNSVSVGFDGWTPEFFLKNRGVINS